MKKFGIILLALLGVVLAASVGAFFAWRSTSVREAIIDTTVSHLTNNVLQGQNDVVNSVLGFDKPRTYLVLFQNNTELRPSGGFVGSYAVVKLDRGIPHILKVEGTEILDLSVPQTWFPAPPAPLGKYLRVKHWQFRDGNWSPDFAEASRQEMEFFLKEQGVGAKDIAGVIGIDPTVIQSVLAITGPITVDGVKFDSTNFTRALEYEVEYGYEDRGQTVRDRKNILKDLTIELVKRSATEALTHWGEYAQLLPTMLAQKHLVMFSLDPTEQRLILARDWGGAMRATENDFVLWADANLGALKTDASLDRSLSYTIKPVGKTFQATVAMTFVHHGTFDKFTSRYRDYARVYVPVGSKLISAKGAMDSDKSTKPGVVDQGVENGRQWFGAFTTVEPKSTKTLSFTFELAPEIVEQIRTGHYELLVQKQIGTLQPGLTLHLDFAKTLAGAIPGEGPAKHGDSVYDLVTDLSVDRTFRVTLAP